MRTLVAKATRFSEQQFWDSVPLLLLKTKQYFCDSISLLLLKQQRFSKQLFYDNVFLLLRLPNRLLRNLLQPPPGTWQKLSITPHRHSPKITIWDKKVWSCQRAHRHPAEPHKQWPKSANWPIGTKGAQYPSAWVHSIPTLGGGRYIETAQLSN